jgi:glycosyltransferase involved in cell wall biosynthesis
LNNIGNISVVIPTYNRRKTIGRSIDSVLNQTLFPSEIIVVDDGSTDGTSDYIQSNFPSIRLLQQTNKGVSSARNMGIRSSNSDWVALLDSDDEWFPQKLEKQVMTLSQSPDIKFCHTEEIWIRNGVRVNQMKKHQKYGGHIFYKCLDMCRISPSSVLFHQSILDDVGYFDKDLKVCEDYDLWLRITAKFPVLYIDESLIKKYGGHEDQLSRVKDGIESHRIKVLEKLIMKKFTSVQRNAMLKTLIEKLTIFSIGAQKRGKIKAYNTSKKRINELSVMV